MSSDFTTNVTGRHPAVALEEDGGKLLPCGKMDLHGTFDRNQTYICCQTCVDFNKAYSIDLDQHSTFQGMLWVQEVGAMRVTKLSAEEPR